MQLAYKLPRGGDGVNARRHAVLHRDWSPWQDRHILARTVKTVPRWDRAY